MNSISCFFYLKDVFFLNERSKLSAGKGEKCSFSQNSFWNPKLAFLLKIAYPKKLSVWMSLCEI